MGDKLHTIADWVPSIACLSWGFSFGRYLFAPSLRSADDYREESAVDADNPTGARPQIPPAAPGCRAAGRRILAAQAALKKQLWSGYPKNYPRWDQAAIAAFHDSGVGRSPCS